MDYYNSNYNEHNSHNLEELQYQKAAQQVYRIKGFYKHLIVFIVMNIFFVVVKLQKNDPKESVWEVLYVTFFWGIGLLFHGLKVFGWSSVIGKNWEQKKIQEILEKEKEINKN